MTDKGVELTTTSRAARAAGIIEAAITSGRLSVADLALFADAFERAGWRVEIPHPEGGYLTTRRKKCGKKTCHCAAPEGRKHGPYVYRRARDEWGKPVEEYLGRVRTPGDAPRVVLGKRGKKLPHGELPEGVIHDE